MSHLNAAHVVAAPSLLSGTAASSTVKKKKSNGELLLPERWYLTQLSSNRFSSSDTLFVRSSNDDDDISNNDDDFEENSHFNCDDESGESSNHDIDNTETNLDYKENSKDQSPYDELVESSRNNDDEQGEKSLSGNKYAGKNYGIKAPAEGDKEDHYCSDTSMKEKKNHKRYRELRRLNKFEFGIHPCILGHRIPRMAIDYGRRRHHHYFDANGLIDCDSSTLPNTDLFTRKEHQLQFGKCGINILSRLVVRSCIPSSTSRMISSMKKFVHSGNHFNICNTVKLASSEAGRNSSADQSSGDICVMSFDKDGVLLATGDDRGSIRIYDFDDVCAMDMKKRNEIARLRQDDYSVLCAKESHQNEECEEIVWNEESSDDKHVDDIPPSIIQPVLSFQCVGSRSSGNRGTHRISSIQWSPYNQDHLAISFA